MYIAHFISGWMSHEMKIYTGEPVRNNGRSNGKGTEIRIAECSEV